MAIDIVKKFWDKLSLRHDNLGRDDAFYAIFNNGFSKANMKVDHLTKVVIRECDEECLKKIEDGLVALDIITRAPKQFLKTDFEIINKIDKNIFTYIGNITFSDYDFLFFEGNGGHVKGETIILCEKLKLLFTGDIFVNIKGFSAEQKEFNQLAPFLMTGVDENSAIAKTEREYIKEFFKDYTICPGHGGVVLN